ncbi:MAG: beta-N-acetylhexosaminidase [archaeon]|nr:beta-N-acetylhexosaminidase [archaeon]
MKLSFISVFICCLSLSYQLIPKYVKNQLLIMPYPQSVSANFGGSDSVEISSDIKLNIVNSIKNRMLLEENSECDANCKEFLNDNFKFSITDTLTNQKGLKDFRLSLHKQLDLEQIIPNIKGTLSTVTVRLTGEEVFPKLNIGICENYTLSISTSEIIIEAPTVYGARHAFETLSQIIRIYENKFIINQLPINIEDYPRFKWRGLLVDPVRGTFEPSMFYRIVDALAMLKNNIIHIHLSDGQQFLLETSKYENLAKKGAGDTTKIFTKDFIKQLVAYGRKRGVIIYGEVDIPGHSASWGLGYPGLVADCWNEIVSKKKNYGENNPALSPVYNETEEVIKDVVTELGDAFDFDYVHIGGDEVVTTAWSTAKEKEEIDKFMKEKGFKEYIELEGYLTKIAQQKILENKRYPVLYSELYVHGYAEKGSIVHIWSDGRLFNQTLQDGYKVIISTAYYLDKQMPLCKGYEKGSCDVTHNKWAWTYKDFYSFEPEDHIDPKLMDGFLGIEGCSWDESCDRENFFNRVFQRYFPIAERMWSSKAMKENNSAEIRGMYLRCLALRRKIYDGAGPISPTLCDLNIEE